MFITTEVWLGLALAGHMLVSAGCALLRLEICKIVGLFVTHEGTGSRSFLVGCVSNISCTLHSALCIRFKNKCCILIVSRRFNKGKTYEHNKHEKINPLQLHIYSARRPFSQFPALSTHIVLSSTETLLTRLSKRR
jgi:hypothetical protein